MRTLLIGVCLIFTATTVKAQNEISLGADIITPAISGEYELSEKASVRLDVGFNISNSSLITLNPQLHFHKINNAYDLDEVGILVPYHGPGFLIGADSDGISTVAFEFVWGFELDLEEYPIEIFADVGPSLLVDDDSSALSLTSSFGVRYKF